MEISSGVKRPLDSNEGRSGAKRLKISHAEDEIKGLSITSLLKGLDETTGGSSAVASLKRQLELIKNTEAALEPISRTQKTRIERKVAAENAKKTLSSWIPITQHYRRSTQLKFGPSTPSTTSTATVAAAFKPMDDFEKELALAVKEAGVTEEAMKKIAGFAPAKQIQQEAQRKQLAKVKALLHKQHMKSKRVNRIKSKAWHRMRKKNEDTEREVLLEKLKQDNPEAAKRLLEEYERRRAEMRMQTRTHARKKWTQLALRFGGRDMQSVITDQAQRFHDEKQAVERIARTLPGQLERVNGSDGELDSGSEADSSSSEDEKETASKSGKTKSSSMDKLKKQLREVSIDSSSSEEEDEDGGAKGGIGAMKFMREARRKEREQMREEAKKFLKLVESSAADKDEEASSELIDPLSKKEQKKKQRAKRRALRASQSDVELKMLSVEEKGEKEEKEEKAKELRVSRGEEESDDDLGFAALRGTNRGDRKGGKKEKDGESGGKKLNDGGDSAAFVGLRDGSSLVEDMVTLADAVASAQEAINTREGESAEVHADLVKQVFVSTEDVEREFQEYVEKEKEQAELEANKDKLRNGLRLPGWGSWCGVGIRPKGTTKTTLPNGGATSGSAKGEKKSALIYVNPNLDRKVAKYSCRRLPYPFYTKDDFNNALKHPLGPEWNTAASYGRLTQPEIVVTPGTVIAPLKYAKALPGAQKDKFLSV